MSKKTKKLKDRLNLAEYRLLRLERNLSELETHTYDAVSDDIERLHDSVDMWAPPLKDRVAALEEMALAFALDELRNATLEEVDWDPFGENVDAAMGVVDSAFEQLIQGLDALEQQEIRDRQVTPTESIPAWLLAKRSNGGFYLNKYYVPDGEETAIGEKVFEVSNLDQLEDLVQYIQDTLAVTGWDEGQL